MKPSFYLKNLKTADVVKIKSKYLDLDSLESRYDDYNLYAQTPDKVVDFDLLKNLTHETYTARLVEEFPNGFQRTQFIEWPNVFMKSWEQCYIEASTKYDFFQFSKMLKEGGEDYVISYSIIGPDYVKTKPFSIEMYFNSDKHSLSKKMLVEEFILTFKGTVREQEKAMKQLIVSLKTTNKSNKKIKP